LSVRRNEGTGLVVLRKTHALPPLAVGILEKQDRPFRILDFGGSGGIDYLGIKETVGRMCIIALSTFR